MVTGIDLVRSQILIAEGRPLSDPEIGIASQADVTTRGYSIQCRVTTEDPANNFAPDTGKITAYRSSGGFGIRLDAGNTYVGAEISPYYDSLLVKITTLDNTFEGACRKALRALSETRIRGVKTNISFVSNILSNPVFRAGQCYTKFIDDTPELFTISQSQNRSNKMLEYIGNIVVNDPTAGQKLYETPRFPDVPEGEPKPGLKQFLDQNGPEALSKWVLDQKKLLVTDTTCRDAHQSLLATRMRTRDMVKCAPAMAKILADCFSLEMWGGATFDVAYRFLNESPWERLDWLRREIPNIPFQMLLRGSNTVGYTSYPDNVVREFVRLSAEGGIDVFRIFDSLNWLPSMEVAIDEALKQNKFVEGTICYTGEITDTSRNYTLKYYVDMAKELQKMGCHSVAIKDMSGLLKPYSAKVLVSGLKDALDIPVHLHTHDTTGNQVATTLMAAEAGVDIADLAISSMSSLTSQPSMNAVVAALEGQERDTGLSMMDLQKLTDYWADVRERYVDFESDLKTPVTDIYRYEIPGGQYTNLKPQVESLNLGHRFLEVKEMYKKVNDMLGDIVKVTPSSKMVGDLAIFMVQNDLTPENIVEKGAALSYPDSVVSYFKGMMGQPAWGFPKDLQKIVLKGEEPISVRPGALLPPADFEAAKEHLCKVCGHEPSERDVISWLTYPKVLEDYFKNRAEYGYLTRLGSHVYFHGLAVGETNRVNIEDGKTLVIKYLGLGDANEDGTRVVQFELNGMRREINVQDKHAKASVHAVEKADPDDPMQVGASIPGAVSKVLVKKGDEVKENDVLLIIEAMKMETSVVARADGVVGEVKVEAGDSVVAGQLLMTLKEAEDED